MCGENRCITINPWWYAGYKMLIFNVYLQEQLTIAEASWKIMAMKYASVIAIVLSLAFFLPSCDKETKSLKEELRVIKEENSFLKAENIALKKEVEELYKKVEERDKVGGAPEASANTDVLKKDTRLPASDKPSDKPERPDADRRKPETEKPH